MVGSPVDHLRHAIGLIPGKRSRAVSRHIAIAVTGERITPQHQRRMRALSCARRIDKASCKTRAAKPIATVIIGEGLAQAGRQPIAYPDHRQDDGWRYHAQWQS